MCLRRASEKYIPGAKAPTGAALDRAGLDNRLIDGGKAVSPTITILDIFHPPVFYLKLH
jgi:hypothetical protein